jgi:hypothetical protein
MNEFLVITRLRIQHSSDPIQIFKIPLRTKTPLIILIWIQQFKIGTKTPPILCKMQRNQLGNNWNSCPEETKQHMIRGNGGGWNPFGSNHATWDFLLFYCTDKAYSTCSRLYSRNLTNPIKSWHLKFHLFRIRIYTIYGSNIGFWNFIYKSH